MKRSLILLVAFVTGYAGKSQNVGIGTANPVSGKLEVVASGTQLMTSSGLNQAGISHSVPLGLSPSLGFNLYYGNAFRFMTAGYGSMIQYSPSTGILYFSTSQTKGNPGDLTFFNSNSVALDSNGYLGIGTTAPKAKLHVASSMVIGTSSITPATGYMLSIAGKVICEEVKVQLNSNWPDYVFKDDYKLMPLRHLESSIRKNRHLPNIPSATQIEKEGVSLGEMNSKIMEKVEELTLYIIELNKKNEDLQRQVNRLKKQLKIPSQ